MNCTLVWSKTLLWLEAKGFKALARTLYCVDWFDSTAKLPEAEIVMLIHMLPISSNEPFRVQLSTFTLGREMPKLEPMIVIGPDPGTLATPGNEKTGTGVLCSS